MMDTQANVEFVIDPNALDAFLNEMGETLPAKNESCPPFDEDKPLKKAAKKKAEPKAKKAKAEPKAKAEKKPALAKAKKAPAKKEKEPKAAKPKAEKKSKPSVETPPEKTGDGLEHNADVTEKTSSKPKRTIKTRTKEEILAEAKKEEEARQSMAIPAPKAPEAPSAPNSAATTAFADALRSDKVNEVLKTKKPVDSEWLDPAHLKSLDEGGYRKAIERAKAIAGRHWKNNVYSEVVRYLKPFRNKLTGNNLDRLVQSEKRLPPLKEEALAA